MIRSRNDRPSRASTSDFGLRSPIEVARPPLSLIVTTCSSAAAGSASGRSSSAGTSSAGSSSALAITPESPETSRSYALRNARTAASGCPASRIFASAALKPSAFIRLCILPRRVPVRPSERDCRPANGADARHGCRSARIIRGRDGRVTVVLLALVRRRWRDRWPDRYGRWPWRRVLSRLVPTFPDRLLGHPTILAPLGAVLFALPLGQQFDSRYLLSVDPHPSRASTVEIFLRDATLIVGRPHLLQV